MVSYLPVDITRQCYLHLRPVVENPYQQTELGTPSNGECFPALLVLENLNACCGATAYGEKKPDGELYKGHHGCNLQRDHRASVQDQVHLRLTLRYRYP